MTIRETTALIYPDEYIVEQDQMGISAAQTTAVRRAVNVLEPHYEQRAAQEIQAETEPDVDQAPTWVATELNHYHPAVQNSQKLIVPDIAVFDGINIPLILQKTLPSWDMRGPNHRPPPPLVIEICSPETYDGDILPQNKPRLYGLIGVREYFAYDPNVPRVWPMRGPNRVAAGVRLLGWRYGADGSPQSIEPSQEVGREGWLWSEVLGLWLVPNGGLLEFYTDEGERLPDRDEIVQQARQEAQHEAQARQEAEQGILRESQARQTAEQARQEAEQARQEAEQATFRESQARQAAEQREAQARQEIQQIAQRQAQTDQQLADLQRQLDEMRRRLNEG